MKPTLDIDQSAHLIALGVDPKLARRKKFVPIHPEVLKGNAEFAKPWGWFPVFDLSDILNILPKEITKREDDYLLVISAEYLGKWEVWYRKCRCDYGGQLGYQKAPELIDALYQLLCWTIEQGYVKPKPEEK